MPSHANDIIQCAREDLYHEVIHFIIVNKLMVVPESAVNEN